MRTKCSLPAITADEFPFTLPGSMSATFVLSAYVGKSERHFSVLQAWRVTPDRYDLLDQFRKRTEFGDFQDHLDEYIALYDPAAILASSAPGRKALMAGSSADIRVWSRLLRLIAKQRTHSCTPFSTSLSSDASRFLPKRRGATSAFVNFVRSQKGKSVPRCAARCRSSPTRTTSRCRPPIRVVSRYLAQPNGRRLPPG